MSTSTVLLETELSHQDVLGGRTPRRSGTGFYRAIWNGFLGDRLAIASLLVFVLIVAFVIGAPVVSHFTGYGYSENHLPLKLSGPMQHGFVLGSDANGRDILTRLAYGGRASLLVALFATVSEFAFGMGLGIVSGYFGSWVDAIIMRFVDVMLSIPGLSLLILISSLFHPGLIVLSVLIGAISWPGDARLIRGEVLAIRGREYIEAAKVVGAPSGRIIFKHLIPNVTPIMMIQISLAIPGAILTEAIISFLGLGIQVPDPSWGNMLDEATRFYRLNWTNVFFPGFMIYITSLVLYLVNIGLRDALDPKLKM